MKVIIQRVSRASVSIGDSVISSINNGMLILLGVHNDDNDDDYRYLINKISGLRIFSDKNDKMNLSITESKGSILLVSQFTLYARTKKGNRPSFIDASNEKLAHKYYDQMKNDLSELVPVKTGKFGEYMMIDLINDGPVTIIIDSKNKE